MSNTGQNEAPLLIHRRPLLRDELGTPAFFSNLDENEKIEVEVEREDDPMEKLIKMVAKSKSRIERLPTFNGDANEDVDEYLIDCLSTASYNNWSNEELMRAIPLSLKKTAKVFYQSLDMATKRNFKEFSDAMQQEYNPPEKVWLKRSELYSLRQGDLSLDKYVAKLEKLAQEAGIDAPVRRDLFINGLNENLQEYLKLKQPRT